MRLTAEPIVFILDPAGDFKFVNRVGQRLIGLLPEKTPRLNVVHVMSVEAANEIRNGLKRSMKQRIGRVFELEIRTRDGRHVLIEASVHLAKRNGIREIHGIAVPLIALDYSGNRLRCLDEQFTWGTPHSKTSTVSLAEG